MGIGRGHEGVVQVVGARLRRQTITAEAILALLYVLTIAALFAWMVLMTSYAEAAEQEEYLPGQPLDALRMEAPAFADGDRCYKVADRTTGACWYLVQMHGKSEGDVQWVVLPVADGDAVPGVIPTDNTTK